MASVTEAEVRSERGQALGMRDLQAVYGVQFLF